MTRAQNKIFNLQKMLDQIMVWHQQGDKVVFTNGCFDLLHPGHIRYLEEAAALGDRLIIAVNDDASVCRLKGSTRPINRLHDRMYVLASLSCVDGVVSFSEDTPLEIINLLTPDVLVKGGDYTSESIVGAKEIIGWGGHVVVIPFVDGFSTTILENKILEMHQNQKKKS